MRALLTALCLAACAAPTGTLELLTYNVAGLPEGLSDSHPETNHPQIAAKLDRYDLVAVQEDFAYHELLARSPRLPYLTDPSPANDRPMGDGLAFFSRFPLGPVEHVRWLDCAGTLNGASDCLADKGFAVTTVTLADGVDLLVYDHHADAGGSPDDAETRRLNFAQLAAHLATHAAGRAVIVAGDTNLRDTREADQATLTAFLADTGLADACGTLRCPTETIDRVLFRGSDALELTPTTWRFADELVDAAGEPLSDHRGVHVGLEWRRR